MQVPNDLPEIDCIHTKNHRISVARYYEDKPSKIYTNVNENLMVIIRKGKKRLIYKDYEVTIGEGEFAFFKKGNYIMNQIINDGIYESILIFVSDDMIKSILQTEIAQDESIIVPYYKGNVVSHMYAEMELFMNLFYENAEKYEYILEMKVRELLQYILVEDDTHKFAAFLQQFFMDGNLTEYMENNYDKINDIKNAAHTLNMSLSTFKRRFYEVYRCTPHKWMNDRKLEKASILLNTSEYSVTDICFICGFRSLPTFQSLFQHRFGVSPGKYRKQKIRCNS